MNVSQSTVTTAYATDCSNDVDSIGRLFDAYRAFYEREPDSEAARRYVSKRLRAGSSHFIKASADDRIVGFAHLSEMLDTLAMRDAWMLEDLFVDPRYRGRGVASALLQHAESFARNTNASCITLRTAHENTVARSVYETHGYVSDEAFATYHRRLAP